MRIAVVIPVWNRPERLEGLLPLLEAQTLDRESFEIIVGDDGSTTEAAARFVELMDKSVLSGRVLRSDDNRGPARARNLGWRSTDAPIVAFLDDDCTPVHGWLAAGLAAITADPAIGVVQGRTAPPPGTVYEDLPVGSNWRDVDGTTHWFEGCNIFYRRVALEQTGGFDEEIGWWGEDVACGWAVVDAGWKRGFAGDARVEHSVERRPLRWWLEQGWNDRKLVVLAARHPGFRAAAFWRPWAVRERDAWFALAALGLLLAGLGWRPAALASLLYVHRYRPSLRLPNRLRNLAWVVSLDAGRAAGVLAGSIRARVVVV